MKTQQKPADSDTLLASIETIREDIQKLITTINATPSNQQPPTVLIYGAPGTEKELVAQFIHAGLKNDINRFIILDCSLMPASTIQEKLSRYLKQPPGGKDQNDSSLTIVLHKINSLKLSVLSQLLSLLKTMAEDDRLQNKPLQIMATIDRHLKQSGKETGVYKELERCFLHGCRITIPSLKERKEDIPLLLNTVSTHYCRKYNQKRIRFSAQGTEILSNYPWRGNIKEMKRLVEYLVLHKRDKTISINELPVHFRHRTAHNHPWSNLQTEINWDREQIDFRQRIDQLETELIVAAMRKSGGNKMEAARLLNLKRTTLLEKIKKKRINHLWEDESPSNHND